MTPAARWGAELRTALRRRGRTQSWLTRALGLGQGTVGGWHRGERLPMLEHALAAAEVLDWGRLRSLIVELRTRTCERCGSEFVTSKALDASWCSYRCRQYRHWTKKNARRKAELKERNGYTIALQAEVIDRMCRQWCPGGREDNLCPDATCPIQEAGLSPWPVATGVLGRVA